MLKICKFTHYLMLLKTSQKMNTDFHASYSSAFLERNFVCKIYERREALPKMSDVKDKPFTSYINNELEKNIEIRIDRPPYC